MAQLIDRCSVEQQFQKSDVITFDVLKFWSHTYSATKYYGRLVGRRSIGKFQFF